MDIRPIVSTLRRHKTAAALIALEIALTCAIVSNAVFLIGTRLDRVSRPSGVAEAELIQVQLVGVEKGVNAQALTRQDLAALRGVSGVRSVATTNQIPFGRSSWNSGVNLQPDQQNPTLIASTYLGNEDLVETLGLRLVAGRDFEHDEYVEFEALQSGAAIGAPAAILTSDLAERLFPGESPLGKSIYVWGNSPVRVVGVVNNLMRPNEIDGAGNAYNSLLLSVTAPTLYGSSYLLRVERERRTEILEAAIAALETVSASRIVLPNGTRTFEAFRDDFYRQDRAMAWLLVAVCAALLIVTALGIIGLASFWVQQRTRQIGIRRALGATRGQILGYFQTENFLITTFGILIGMTLAFTINALLMERYELPRLPWHYLPAGAVALWLLGQLAVLGPAMRAAAVPPAVATRNV
jgi:putative ABC transport system permease protein